MFFDGIGKEFVKVDISFVFWGIVGYGIGIKHNSIHMQVADNDAKQTQRLKCDGEGVGGIEGSATYAKYIP